MGAETLERLQKILRSKGGAHQAERAVGEGCNPRFVFWCWGFVWFVWCAFFCWGGGEGVGLVGFLVLFIFLQFVWR